VSAVDDSLTLESAQLYEGLFDAIDARTREIVERRRRAPFVRRRGWLVRRALVTADLLGLSLATLAATATFGAGGSSDNHLGLIGEYGLLLAALPLWVVMAKLYGLYDRDEERTDHSTADDFTGVFHLATVMSWLLYATTRVLPLANPAFGKIMLFWAVAVTSIPFARAAARGYCRRHLAYVQNTLIVGAGTVGQTIARKLLQHPEYGINLVGFVDDRPKERGAGLEHLALLGDISRIPALIQLFDVERVIVAFSNDSQETVLELVRELKDFDVQVDIVPRLFELIAPGVGVHTVEGLALVGLPPLRLSRSSMLLKRTLDLAVTVPALLILAPLFVVLAILIRLDSSGPVFFRQVRMGSGDRTFRILKFRSMVADADDRKAEVAHLNQHLRAGGDPRMFKVANDPRVTRVGRWMRRLSLDELPQLFNVAKGEMSLVGARPLILEEDQFVEDWGRRRLNLKPGITGLWQVLGRSEIPFSEMVRLDYVYVTSWSLMNDLQLIVRTIPALFRSTNGAV
jgi:exopolysaccharide biosynthesis polyprenyl glycosylphosphotransferase